MGRLFQRRKMETRDDAEGDYCCQFHWSRAYSVSVGVARESYQMLPPDASWKERSANDGPCHTPPGQEEVLPALARPGADSGTEWRKLWLWKLHHQRLDSVAWVYCGEAGISGAHSRTTIKKTRFEHHTDPTPSFRYQSRDSTVFQPRSETSSCRFPQKAPWCCSGRHLATGNGGQEFQGY